MDVEIMRCHVPSFNPRAGTRAGATLQQAQWQTGHQVSIHAPALVPARPASPTFLHGPDSVSIHAPALVPARPCIDDREPADLKVSIHAPALVPARRSTRAQTSPRSRFQSTRRHSCRRDQRRPGRLSSQLRFNPRAGTRAGATVAHYVIDTPRKVDCSARTLKMHGKCG